MEKLDTYGLSVKEDAGVSCESTGENQDVMDSDFVGFCGFCGGELSSRTEDCEEGFHIFMECGKCHKVWRLVINQEGTMIAYEVVDNAEEEM